MEEYHLDLQQALYWLSGYAFKIISNFLANPRAVPSWGEKIDRAVMVYHMISIELPGVFAGTMLGVMRPTDTMEMKD
jgi:hypothetical protein